MKLSEFIKQLLEAQAELGDGPIVTDTGSEPVFLSFEDKKAGRCMGYVLTDYKNKGRYLDKQSLKTGDEDGNLI